MQLASDTHIPIVHKFIAISLAATCEPYSEQACRDAAKALGLKLGGGGYAFSGAYSLKGCYSYRSGTYAGIAFYGTGGTDCKYVKH